MRNPLLSMGHGLPEYQAISPADIQPAIEQLLENAYAAIQQAETLKEPPSWNNFIVPLEESSEALSRAWGVINHLTSVADHPELRAAHAEMLPKVVAFSSALLQNEVLFKHYQALRHSSEWEALTPSQKTSIEHTLRDFRLGGAELSTELKPKFAQISEDLANLCKTFSDHVLDATDTFLYVVTDATQLAGLPNDIQHVAAELAQEHGKEGWAFNLKFPSYYPVQQLAEYRPLRQTMYEAYVTRASDLGPKFGNGDPAWDNSELMLQILKLRQTEAKMLGYKNYAELSLVPKMAGTVDEVRSFLKEFSQRARPQAEADLYELQQFASKHLGIDSLQPWDIAFASEKLKQSIYEFSEHEVKQYFPIDKVLHGLFEVIETVLQVRITPTNLPIWHQDVQSFCVSNLQNEPIAYFYLDAYARTGKRGGAWMDDARGRKINPDGSCQLPVAYLVCNFPPPLKNPDGTRLSATISHDDVITLFHEFGHGLHHMLTRINTLGVSGINGVEWDAVELPSQFMENFCWDAEVLEKLSEHIQSKLPLPTELLNKMVAAKNFQNGLFTLRQLVFACVDWELHSSLELENASPKDILKLAETLNNEIHVLPQSPISRWLHSFTHVFVGGYAAGYYSYKWAEVLSADAFAAFEEHVNTFGSILNPKVGITYRTEILEVGGSRPAAESFKAFRGRPPQIDALLRHGGLIPNTNL